MFANTITKLAETLVGSCELPRLQVLFPGRTIEADAYSLTPAPCRCSPWARRSRSRHLRQNPCSPPRHQREPHPDPILISTTSRSTRLGR
ncbi:hypothetical protein FIBSPDRAFT_170368 [Athelia psychrophila]|uniref:Uncharacterized protein n=1 Tax=Athelia psychrophila TaxID=1759441 RepID=A0A166AWS9_9AGAM|nr:hypothetical protein FIBSPDRAFT_170368 [Fibularhizoctonia sp. CBS 109695]